MGLRMGIFPEARPVWSCLGGTLVSSQEGRGTSAGGRNGIKITCVLRTTDPKLQLLPSFPCTDLPTINHL